MRGPVRIEEDGTRVYSNGTRYKPVSPEARRYQRRRPDHPEAVRFHGKWFLPLEVLPDDQRPPMPATRPDEEAYEHMDRTVLCRCEVCQRPAAEAWRRRWRRDKGLRP